MARIAKASFQGGSLCAGREADEGDTGHCHTSGGIVGDEGAGVRGLGVAGE